MTDYCVKSDLPVEMCAHCRGFLEEPPPPRLTILRRIEARYDGRCAMCGKWTVRQGDPLYLVNDELGGVQDAWVGSCCAKK